MEYIKKAKKKKIKAYLIFLIGILGFSGGGAFWWLQTQSIQRPSTLTTPLIQDPAVKTLSSIDLLVLGARKDALAMPAYVNAYYAGGYPPEDEGTCTDLVWRAFMEAGVELKVLVDEDILNNRQAYPNITIRDPNIDFRRVQNLKIFFERNAVSLTTNVYETDQWQAGDIVIFGRSEHIGIVSDIRNEKDIPYLIHNNDQPIREEDRLEYGSYTMGITGHYRFVFNQP